MVGKSNENEALEAVLDYPGWKGRALFAGVSLVGVALVVSQAMAIKSNLVLAEAADISLRALLENDPSLIADTEPFQTSALIARNIAIGCAGAIAGVLIFVAGVALSLPTYASRALKILVKRELRRS